MAKKLLIWVSCFPTDHPDCDSEDDFHPGMLVGLVPDPVEQQRERDGIMVARYPQIRCDVCQENDALSPNGGLLMCDPCLVAVGCSV